MIQTGTALVFIHGLCSTHDEMLVLQSAVKKAGIAGYPLTIPGYTFDENLTKQVASPYASWIQSVLDLVKTLKKTHEKVFLVGLSSGATLALGACLTDHEGIDGVIALSTPLFLSGWNIPFYHFLLPLALYTPLGRFWKYKESSPYGVKDERVRSWIVKELNQRRISCAGASVLEIPHLREHDRLKRWVRKSLLTHRCPVKLLAIHSKEDEMAGLNNVEYLQKYWSKGFFNAIFLNNSYHMITIDYERLVVSQEVVKFINT